MSCEETSLLASDRAFRWTLQKPLSFDPFSWQDEGAAALLLMGMHIRDGRPWTCARNPVLMPRPPGLLDRESKRILGKRYQLLTQAVEATESWVGLRAVPIDPIAEVLQLLDQAGHSFASPSAMQSQWEKLPGKLLPRKLTAKARITLDQDELTLYSRNFSEISQCLHAELTLLFGLNRILSERVDPPAQLHQFELETSLKPCKMCAAFLHSVRQHCRSFAVRYERDDPGRLAANTLLDRYGYQSPC